MSRTLYCKLCGMPQEEHDSEVTGFQHASRVWCQVAKLQDKIDRAPHDEDCASVMHTGPVTRYGVAPCNCWKSRP